MNARRTVLTVVAAAAVIATGACSNQTQPVDDGLKQDLAAARAAATSHISISPLELGERAAPAAKPAPITRAPRASKPASAKQPAVVVAKAPEVRTAPAPVAPEPAPARTPEPQAEQQPRPSPVSSRGEEARHGPYKTEAEIFRQMPWIRP